MNKNRKFFSLHKASKKVAAGQKKEFLLELKAIMGYVYLNSVYRLVSKRGIAQVDVEKYRAINQVLNKYGLNEQDWEMHSGIN